MKTISYKSKTFASAIRKLDRRAVPSDRVFQVVSGVIDEVRKKGDRAVSDFARKFDKVDMAPAEFRVTEEQVAAASKRVTPTVKRAINASHRNVQKFSLASRRKGWSMRNAQGVSVGEIYQPFQRVGVYVPGGTAPLVSTALMTVTLAAAAGVPEIVVCTPCGRERTINDGLLHALRIAGATEIYRIGGAQAIAAMGLGTKTIAPVVKIFGPGNSYVVEAKRQLIGSVSIDLLPGPSEILVLADSSGKASYIASDLLAQAEHGGDSQVCFVTDCEELLEEVKREVRAQSKSLSRQEPIAKVLKEGTTMVLVEEMLQGIEIANAYAPEHLTLIARNETSLMKKITSAGAIFLGNYSPVAVGDFLAGPSHTLPTGGAGKSFPGLTVDQFQKRTSVVKLNRESIAKSAPIVETLAGVEGLDAHARSATIRTESK